MTTIFDTRFRNTFSGLIGGPFFTGTSAISPDVPRKWQIALDGRGFMLDGEPLWRTIQTLRAQQDDREAAELSLNPEGLWRRSASSWELGAGQVHYDDENAQRQRYRASKGLDVWTPGRITLLPDTTLVDVVGSGAGAVNVESTEAHVYWLDDHLVVQSDLTTSVDVSGTPPTTATSMVSTGSVVLVGFANAGVYKIAGGSGAASPWITTGVTPSVVGWAKGRVLVGVGQSIYNPTHAFTTSAILPAIPLLQHPDGGFRWVAVAEGLSNIYMGGVSGDKSTIYRCIVRADGTSLDVPVVAGRLPDGEILTTMFGYLGVLVAGTTKGVRVLVPAGNGDLVVGSLIDIGHEVLAMAGWGTFVYFSWSNYDQFSTGIGRIDLSNLTDEDNFVPAYASDLMATAQGAVAGIAVLDGTIVFGVNGAGIFRQAATLVGVGEITTGLIRYGITEEKVVTGARASITGPGTTRVEVSVDGADYKLIAGTGAQERGVNYEMRITITGTDTEVSPALESATLYSYPAPEGTMFIDVPVLINEKVITVNNVTETMQIAETLEFLRDRFKTKVLVTGQIGTHVFQVTLEQFQFKGSQPAVSQIGEWNGTAPLALKVLT